LLLLGGRELGENWRGIAVYLDTYGEAMTVLILLIVGVVLVRRWKRSRAAAPANGGQDVNE
jgi:hypothetical protein